LGRSLSHLPEIVESLGSAGGGFQSLCDNIDTTTANNRLGFSRFRRYGGIRARPDLRTHARRHEGGHAPRPSRRPAAQAHAPAIQHPRELLTSGVLSGVYNLTHLEHVQGRTLTLIWGHDLKPLTHSIESTR
jgi:hypothetical protein